MGMDSTVNINTGHVHSIQVAATNLGQNIQDGALGTDTNQPTVEMIRI